MTHDEIMTALAKRGDVYRALEDAIDREAQALKAGSLGTRYRGRLGMARAVADAREFYANDISEQMERLHVPSPSDVLFSRRAAVAWGVAWYVRAEMDASAAEKRGESPRGGSQAKASEPR